MFRLGLRLAVQGGRETIIRLLVTALAVMIGTTLLLSVLATFRGYQIAESKPCFEVSNGDCSAEAAETDKAVLALYRKDAYKGKAITRLDLAKLSDHTISVPGISRMPQAGEYYVSPAMSALLNQAPADELRNRYPGKQVGTIGKAGLHSPDELVILIGRKHTEIASLPGALQIDTIGARQQTDTSATFMQFVAMMGAVALLFPMLILISSATRLGAARREERYAAFRLVGATPRQVSIIASADAALGSILGVAAGIVVFFGLQPFLADFAITGSRAFASDVYPAAWQLILVAVGVPAGAVAASYLSLRRVKISPLGVSRKTTPPTPRAIRLLPLVLGAALFTVAVFVAPSDEPPFAAVPGLALIMIGLVIGGPWLTMQMVRVIAKLTGGVSALLAVRRLSDNPKAAFRSVSGLVLVVFTASVVAFMAPAVLTQGLSAENSALKNVLTVEFFPDEELPVAEGKQLVQQLQGVSGIEVFPIYTDQSAPQGDQSTPQTEPGPQPGLEEEAPSPPPAVIGCDSLKQLKALGTCPTGAQAITVNFEKFEDVILLHQVSLVITPDSQPRTIKVDTEPLRGMLVRSDNASSLEKARTILSRQVVVPAGEVLLTFGETRKAAQVAEDKIQAIISAALVVTLLTAGASVAVAVASSLIERRRPFTLLRLSGAPLSTLYKVVLWEATIPLIGATLVAAAIGFGAAALVITQFAPASANAHIEMPDLPYILALAAGPVVALLVVGATLPLVGRLTKPDDARFE